MAVLVMTSYPRDKAVRLSASTCVRTCAGAILQAIWTTASCASTNHHPLRLAASGHASEAAEARLASEHSRRPG